MTGDVAPLSTTEYAVLGLLAEGPAHGFALARRLESESPVGRVLTVRQPLVYRALRRLVESGNAEEAAVEPGVAGGRRVIHRITPAGRRRLTAWLGEPVGHVRDLRIEFLLKVVLLQRAGLSPLGLVGRQRAALEGTFAAIAATTDDAGDPVQVWRKHTATAAADFLATLEALFGRRRRSVGGT